MPPQNPIPSQDPNLNPNPGQAPNQNPYDFLLNTPPKKKLALNLNGPDGLLKNHFGIVVGVGVGLVLLALLVLTFGGGGSSVPPGLLRVAQTQEDLITSSTAGTQSAVSQPAKDLAINVNLLLTTEQTEFLAYLTANGLAIPATTLGADAATTTGINEATDLTNAVAASNYDPVYVQVTQQQLGAYTQALNADYAIAKNTSERTMLKNYYQAAEQLVKQANYTPSQLPNT